MTSFGLDDVTVVFGDVTAVDGVTMTIAPGAVSALVGGDGAGKTTLLRCLSGRVAPSHGRVHRATAARTGVLTADPPGYSDLTVHENVAFVARARGLDAATTRARAETLLDATGLAGAADRLAARLSGGMRRKLGFALATLHQPALLLLDEPTTGVDPVSRTELWRLIATAARDGTAVVVATTYLDEAERCAQVLALNSGHVLAQGDPAAIVAAVRGRLYRGHEPGPADRSWRRGGGWRVWSPVDGAAVAGEPVEPDLEDAVVVAMLQRQASAATTGVR